MSVRSPVNTGLRAAVTVTQMAAMLGMSRASFYERVRRGHFVPPVYALRTRRPVYLAEMQRQNLEVRVSQIGVNGEFAPFSEKRSRNEVEHSTPGRSERTNSIARGLRERLAALGIENLTDRRVEEAVRACFPAGTNGTSEADALRVVFRYLRRSDAAR